MRRRIRGDVGAAAVEFALIFPLLAALIVGMVDVGFLLNAKIGLTHAAAEGARAAALGGSREAAEERVRAALVASGQLRGLVIDVQPCGEPGTEATVVVSGSVGTVLPAVPDVTITSGAAMSCG